VFARKGFHDATVKEIAAAAEFSVGGVYSFFTDKDDLFVQIYLRRGSEFMRGMRGALEQPGTPRELLHRLADFQVQFFRDNANFGRLYLRASGVTLGELVSKIDQAVVEIRDDKHFETDANAGRIRARQVLQLLCQHIRGL
jgi:AcrR family transcriptional regulator